jgi:hypothetical protein
MQLLGKFLRLTTAERGLLVKAALLLEAIKLGMRLLPFRTVQRLLDQAAEAVSVRPRHADRLSVEKIAWAVETASRRTPGVKTCLAQAMTAQVLLARNGHPSLLRIGVAKGEREQFRAHAWLESQGKVVVGGSHVGRYTPLVAFGQDTPLVALEEYKELRNPEASSEA